MEIFRCDGRFTASIISRNGLSYSFVTLARYDDWHETKDYGESSCALKERRKRWCRRTKSPLGRDVDGLQTWLKSAIPLGQLTVVASLNLSAVCPRVVGR